MASKLYMYVYIKISTRCVTRRKQHQPGITPNDNTTHVPTAGSSAALTKPYHTPTWDPPGGSPRNRQNNRINGHTKPTHTRITYTRMRPHAPSHQAGDHPVPGHTERHNPSKVRTQRQPGLPPRAVSSQGQRHRCRSSRKRSVWGSQAGKAGVGGSGGGGGHSRSGKGEGGG